MTNNLMICTNAVNSLHLNESETATGKKKYILEGIFAELDKLNRNQRIYPKEEYLKHLQYLRNDLKNGEPLMGELDHPDDRFEVKLKEASHRVIDLWYDESKNVVMGKIELLNTPNGLLAQSIVDQGIPLHISSRAAGTVNSDNTVSIQQIYTYDLVCKPGFAGAVLHRVNESVDTPKYSDDVKNFLNNVLRTESMNAAPQYGFVNEDMCVSELKTSANLRKEAKEIQINKQIEININDMNKPLYENSNPDATVGKPLSINGGGAAALGIPTASEDSVDASTGEKDSEDEHKKPVEDVSDKADNSPEKEKVEDKKVSEEGEEEDNKSDDKPKDDEEKDSDEKKDDDSSEEGDNAKDDSSDKGVEIIDVRGEFDEENKDSDEKKDDIVDVKAEYDDNDDNKEDDDNDTDKSDEGCCGKDCSSKEEPEPKEGNKLYDEKDDEKDDKEAKKEQEELDKANKDAEDEAKDIEKRQKDMFSKLDDILKNVEKQNKTKEESKCESLIMAQYPISMMMTESNFAKFIGLNESQKTKVVNYLQDNNITSAAGINESWIKGIEYVADTPIWLKYAPENYKKLYEAASDSVKESLKTTAMYLLFESQRDINNFWENSGLTSVNERKLLNESFINNMPKVAVEEKKTELPYGSAYIQQIADMASEYNRKY